MGTQDNAAFARAGYAAFNRSDLDACAAMAANDAEIVLYPQNRTFHGPDGFRAALMLHKTPAPDGQVEIVRQIPCADGVTNECIYRGTNTGPMPTPDGNELPATGKPFAVPFCEVWRIHDGKLVSLHTYSDNMTVLAQLGLLPAPAAAAR